MTYQNLLIALNFSPKENAIGVFFKKYPQANNYCLEVDLEKQIINYGEKIQIGRNTCLILDEHHEENSVTLECVDRLLSIGYMPENIKLEQGYPAGHGTTKYLDILVYQDEKPYLMIECKTYGEEFNKALKNTQKDGGQLFTYFQQDTKTELLMLYASKLAENKIIFDYKIIKIEEEFRIAGSVINAFDYWNKKFHEKGFWENPPYDFKEEIFTKLHLKELTEDKGKKLFHDFATILRKHSVSDKPNAFNVIFNLFLAKLYDEQKRDEDELEFQWKQNDNPVDFQVRLYDLHKKGLYDFLKKEIEGIEDFSSKLLTKEEQLNAKKKFLKFNKLFDIKSVIDDDDFEQNHRVLKEVVQLIEKYQIRYPRKQKYLSEFFELLLTTGLKQEVGQYFTPPTIAKFIIKSLPLPAMIKQEVNQPTPSLPAVIDYAAGSGHFITEVLEEYQDIIEQLDTTNFYPKAQKEVASWKADQYNWAATYIYGIEKDYRLVKVAKVGCYFYGDGLAQVIHGDGLDSFEKSKSYIGLLKNNAQKPQFSIVVSNPPYSVDDCKDDLEYINSQNEFDLYKHLTDNSDDIECLFVERTKHLLKDGGVAGLILPSSILNNEGIHSKAREIILQYFDIVAITQLGGNTFMATNVNTIVMFLRKRKEKRVNEIKDFAYSIAENYPKTHEDLTINGIEKPVKKYLDYTGENKIDPEKFYYFVLNYHQKTVIVKTGEKEEEKRFLGYKIIKRRGEEGYHPIAGKTIDECTKLYNEKNLEDETKASSYIYKAFDGKYPTIHETLKNNVFYSNSIDMLTFDREKFDKNISLVPRKKVRYDEIWETDKLTSIDDIAVIQKGTSITKEKTIAGDIPVIAGGKEPAYFHNVSNRNGNVITISASGAYSGFVNYFENPIFASDCNTVQSKDEKNISTKLIYLFLKSIQEEIYEFQRGQAQPHVYADDLAKIQIPLPPKEIQQKIVSEIEMLEKKEAEAKEKIENGKNKIEQLFINAYSKSSTILKLSDDFFNVSIGKRVIGADLIEKGTIPIYSANVFVPFGYIDKYLIEDFSVPSVLWGIDGDWQVNYMPANKPFYPTDHCGVLRIKSNEILPKYLAWVLHKEGIVQNFSRTLRASIDRIKGMTIKVPPLSEQQKIVFEIEVIETQITELEQQLSQIPQEKEAVLKKYL